MHLFKSVVERAAVRAFDAMLAFGMCERESREKGRVGTHAARRRPREQGFILR